MPPPHMRAMHEVDGVGRGGRRAQRRKAQTTPRWSPIAHRHQGSDRYFMLPAYERAQITNLAARSPPINVGTKRTRTSTLLHIANLWREQALRSFAGEDTDIPALDFATVAAQFPIKRKRTYLNNASIGPISEPVLAAVDAF